MMNSINRSCATYFSNFFPSASRGGKGPIQLKTILVWASAILTLGIVPLGVLATRRVTELVSKSKVDKIVAKHFQQKPTPVRRVFIDQLLKAVPQDGELAQGLGKLNETYLEYDRNNELTNDMRGIFEGAVRQDGLLDKIQEQIVDDHASMTFLDTAREEIRKIIDSETEVVDFESFGYELVDEKEDEQEKIDNLKNVQGGAKSDMEVLVEHLGLAHESPDVIQKLNVLKAACEKCHKDKKSLTQEEENVITENASGKGVLKDVMEILLETDHDGRKYLRYVKKDVLAIALRLPLWP